MKINVRISGALKTHVETTTSSGDYENVSEYVRDLIRKDKSQREDAAFLTVKMQLQTAFATPRADYESVTVDDVRAIAATRLKK